MKPHGGTNQASRGEQRANSTAKAAGDRTGVEALMVMDRFGIVGKVVARTYQVREVVAEGGFGVVYRAHHQGFRAEVALKCLKIPNELTDEQRRSFLEQFRSEAEVLFRLSAQNSHIVRPLHVDAFHTKEQKLVPFMALEWLEGRTLDALIVQRVERGRPPLELEKLVRLLTPVAGALEQAHHLPGKAGTETVIHRDMKPENLFIARIGGHDVAKVLDFGISKVKSTAGQMVGRASLQEDVLVSFSPAYGAPEQWAPRRFGQTGPWTDVWGLALTVVEAAKGDEVVIGDHQAMMGTILDPRRRPTPRNEGVQVSDAVERIFLRALAVDPKQRYQSVGAFWDDLTLALGLFSEVGTVRIPGSPGESGRNTTAGLDSIRPPTPSGPRSLADPAATMVAAAATQPTLAKHERPRDGALGGANAGLGSYAHRTGTGVFAPDRARPVRSHAVRGVALSRSSFAPARGSVWKALSPALFLIALSVSITVFDRAYRQKEGEPLALGPVQATWVAAALMVLALVNGVSALRRVWHD